MLNLVRRTPEHSKHRGIQHHDIQNQMGVAFRGAARNLMDRASLGLDHVRDGIEVAASIGQDISSSLTNMARTAAGFVADATTGTYDSARNVLQSHAWNKQDNAIRRSQDRVPFGSIPKNDCLNIMVTLSTRVKRGIDGDQTLKAAGLDPANVQQGEIGARIVEEIYQCWRETPAGRGGLFSRTALEGFTNVTVDTIGLVEMARKVQASPPERFAEVMPQSEADPAYT